MISFSTILRTVAALTMASAFLAVLVATLNAFLHVPMAPDLIHAFLESFKAGLFAILGLLGGRASQGQQARKAHRVKL